MELHYAYWMIPSPAIRMLKNFYLNFSLLEVALDRPYSNLNCLVLKAMDHYLTYYLPAVYLVGFVAHEVAVVNELMKNYHEILAN